jgi:hypothetical protein
MALSPTQLQSAYTTTASVRDLNQNMLVADRGPSWIRLMSNGRSLDAAAGTLKGMADGIAVEGADNPWTPKTVDYLRGAAFHAHAGLETLRGGIAEALAGHAELQEQARAILDPASHISIPGSYNDFETAVKHTDPALLDRVAAAAEPARATFERARSDIEQSREFLRGLAQTIPH